MGTTLSPEEMKSEYKSLLQLFTSFFKGNTKPVEKELKNQIEQAVVVQNFERAAKLRDIYIQIEQFVERQHVELPKNITGYVLSLKKIGGWNVYVLLHFYEGKLIDVVREKIAQEEGDFHHIVAGFEIELGEMHIQEVDTYHLLAFSQGMKFLVAEEEALEQLLQGFFDSYVIAASFEGETFHNDLLSTLQERYQFKRFPYRMECIDVSHLSGGWVSGGLTCMVGGILEKKGYRKYKIQAVKGESDDYASLLEILKRRFLKRSDEESAFFPDIFILDGGKGQL